MRNQNTKTKIKETGPQGLTHFTTELCEWAKNLYYPHFCYTRNLQANVVRGVLVPLPENELGRPDFFLFLPGGSRVAIELKTERGALREKQEVWRTLWIGSGGKHYTPQTPEEVLAVFHENGLTRIRFSYQGIAYIVSSELCQAWEGTE